MEDLTLSFADVKYGYMNCIFKPCLVCIGIVSESDIGQSKLFVSSSESEFVPLGPPHRIFCFKSESTVLGDLGGFYYQ